MSLDINTCLLVTIYVEAMLRLLLLFAWVQNPAITAVAWWGSAHLLLALSIVLFGGLGAMPDLIAIDLSNAILFAAFASTWVGARVFDGRPISYVGLFGESSLVACRLPHTLLQSRNPCEMRFLGSSFIITGYTSGRPRMQVLAWPAASHCVSRWPRLSSVFFAHGALFLLAYTAGVGVAVDSEQTDLRQCVADGPVLRSPAVHDRHRLHLAGDGEGASRAFCISGPLWSIH